MSLRVVILGSSAAVPSIKRNLPSVAIKYFGNVYLFDCGEGTQRQMMIHSVSYAKVKAVFITHLHADHYLGLAGLIHTLKFTDRKEKLQVFGPRGINEKIQNLFKVLPVFVEINEIGPNATYAENTFTIKSIAVNHTENSLGYVFEENKKRNFDKEKANRLGIFGKTFGLLEKNGKVKINNKTIKFQDVSNVKK
ncbi:MBL fold metallo-hydrolase, partial [Candidatus Micrarchaeota archaeon]|nr:MBL fold metallo-hydrolase [Candidatus Micrarchaeota archaeon]